MLRPLSARACLGVLAPALIAAFVPALVSAQTGSIAGTVTNQNGGAPISGVTVSAVNASLTLAGTGLTNASGVYTIPGLPPGPYALVTSNSAGFINEVHDNIQCIGLCNGILNAGVSTPVAVTSGATTGGNNFALEMGGQIGGTITTAAGAPLAALVTAVTRVGTSNYSISVVSSNSTGAFLISPLPSGTYYLFAFNSSGFVNEIYPDVTCLAVCSQADALSRGTPIPVTAGATAGGRDISLETGGTLTGTVTNAATGATLAGVQVTAAGRDGDTVFISGTSATNASGVFTIGGLATADYTLFTSNSLGFLNEIFDNILCQVSCSSAVALNSGVQTRVTAGATVAGRNFALDQGGAISGTVTNAATAFPIEGVAVSVFVRSGNSAVFVRSANANTSGVFTISGLPAGVYHLAVEVAPQGLLPEVLGGTTCNSQCSGADALNGTPVSVANGVTTAGQHFPLDPAGSFTGTIRREGTLAPLASVPVFLVIRSAAGVSITLAGSSGSTGVYVISGLKTGTYYAYTGDGTGTLINEFHNNIPCPVSCTNLDLATAGTGIPVTLGATTSGVDFTLGSADAIRGTTTDAATGLPVPGVTVNFLSRTLGTFVGNVTSTLNGLYSMRGLTNGDYVAYTTNPFGYFNEIYDDIRCTSACLQLAALAVGTIIPVTGAAADAGGPLVTSGINVALTLRDDVPGAPFSLSATTTGFTTRFTWIAPTTGALPTSYVLEAGVSPGTTIVSIPATTTSYVASGVPPGTFYVRIRARNAAGTGPPSNEYVLTVLPDGSGALLAPASVVAFMSGDRLTMTWAAPASGGVPAGYVLEAGSASGLANIATVPLTGRSFSYSPVPNGFYFLRVRARTAAGLGPASAEIMIVVGNVPSPPGAPTLSHTVTGSTVALTWIASSFGTATSYLIEAGSATGLSNIATLNTGSTALTMSFSGVPAGTYYVRVRAVNAQGASVVSNERTIIVS